MSEAVGSRQSSFSAILIATAVAGVAGYLVTFLVFRIEGPSLYATFLVFWSTTYLLVGTLSGVQQEVTRATRRVRADDRTPVSRARPFASYLAAIVFVVIVGSAPLWVESVFPERGWAMVWPLAVAASAYVLVAVLCGTLYGISRWRPLAWMIGADSIARLCLVVAASTVTSDPVVLAWSVALPFPLALMLWFTFRRDVMGVTEIDVGYGRLAWNIVRTITASASSALMVSGLPVLVQISSGSERSTLLGVVLFTITLTRAPLIVIAMSMQSYLVVRFRDRPDTAAPDLTRILLVLAVCGGVLGVAGWLAGPWAYSLVAGAEFPLDGGFLAALVASSALVGAMFVTGSALLARSRHVGYSTGWLLAAVSTTVLLVLPVPLVDRMTIVLIAAPLVGLLVHVGYLVAHRDTRVSPAA
jgi:O-antigen/teichoic acid export membrane protein